jgi:2,4-dienoyl-CoA reductase-like NADH-dependent reductase (Old Yellow Enzyme family)/thioredoxin reductase
MPELSNLFSPITVNGLQLENRAVMPAMGTGYGGPDGVVTDRLLAYLSTRARGGVGLIVTEICAVDSRGKGIPTEIGAWSDDLVPSLARIPDAVHRAGVKVALQLHHAGRETLEAFAGATPEAPSPIPSPTMFQPCEEMSLERIAEVVLAYGSAAARAVEAGFDAVEVHGAHGYLINQFLSPFSNQRADEYGGSEENRARFALAVAAAVRDAVGPDYPIIFRVSTEELVQGGYDLSFMKWLAPRLVEAGVDAIHASVGVAATPGGYTIASMDTEPGFNLPRARALKQVVSVPVIAVGRMSDPRLADAAIESGDADMVSFGRQHLADPDFLARARRGDFDHIRWCLACNQGCIERLAYELKAVTCTINPECGWEYKGSPAGAEIPLRVWVIGAGPAGLSAALSASRRGHKVELFERNGEAGGQLLPASRPQHKQALADWVEWASRELNEGGVQVGLGTEVTADSIREGRPDHVILATGALPETFDILGTEGANVFDAREVLLGRVELAGDVVVLGAGYVGMETADFLAWRGHKVTVLEMSAAPPIGKHTTHGYWLHRRLKDAGVKLILGARVVSIEPGAIVYDREGAEERLHHTGPVVTALGATPESSLAAVLDSEGIPYSVVGDAESPRRLLEAVHEGHAAGNAV